MTADKLPDDTTPHDETPVEPKTVDETDVGGSDSVEEDDPESASDDETQEEDATSNVRHLLPVHAAPNTGKNGLKVSRGRGRPRKVERMPTTSDLEYHAAMSEEKAKFISQDPVVVATQGRDALTVLRTIRSEMAKESAALHFQRVESEKYGKDTAQVSSRRLEALNKIASIEFEIKKLGADVIDLHGERFQRVFAFWIETLKEVAQATLPPEQLDLFFNRLETTLDGWEDKASEAMASGK
jgi:hypothetical protein